MKQFGLWTVLAVVGMVIAGGLVSYVWLPQVQYEGQGLLAAWCSAFGVPGNWAKESAPPAGRIPSDVILSHDLMGEAHPSDVARGATLAASCAGCHGPTGGAGGNAPRLAGQYATVVYKQLRDFKSGMRSSAIMSAMTSTLADADMRAIALYYASLRRPAAAESAGPEPAIVKWGAPMRNIPPCGACHGDIEHTMASPWLKGEPEAYLRGELTAFASDTRHNDINAQMRAVARSMSADEISQAAAYYSGARR